MRQNWNNTGVEWGFVFLSEIEIWSWIAAFFASFSKVTTKCTAKNREASIMLNKIMIKETSECSVHVRSNATNLQKLIAYGSVIWHQLAFPWTVTFCQFWLYAVATWHFQPWRKSHDFIIDIFSKTIEFIRHHFHMRNFNFSAAEVTEANFKI